MTRALTVNQGNQGKTGETGDRGTWEPIERGIGGGGMIWANQTNQSDFGEIEVRAKSGKDAKGKDQTNQSVFGEIWGPGFGLGAWNRETAAHGNAGMGSCRQGESE